MPVLTVRASDDLLRVLDEFAAARGLSDRSAAVRKAIREARLDPGEREAVAGRDELLRLLGEAARNGSVAAMKALLEEHRRERQQPADPFAAFDAPVSLVGRLAQRTERGTDPRTAPKGRGAA